MSFIFSVLKEEKSLIFDFGKVTYVSSVAIALLMNVYMQVSRNEKQLVLVNIPEEIQGTLQSAGIFNHIKVYPQIAQALREILSAE